MDGFELDIDELSDDASIGDERVVLCACESVYECTHFRKRNGIVLAFFQAKASKGSGCRGRWDDDYFEAVVYLDGRGAVIVAWREWDDFMAVYEVCADWWKEEFHQTSYYGEYCEDSKFLRASFCWSGDLKARISEEARADLDRDVEAYFRTQVILQDLWEEYVSNNLSRLKMLPKDVMRLLMAACIDSECDDIDVNLYKALQKQAMNLY